MVVTVLGRREKRSMSRKFVGELIAAGASGIVLVVRAKVGGDSREFRCP